MNFFNENHFSAHSKSSKSNISEESDQSDQQIGKHTLNEYMIRSKSLSSSSSSEEEGESSNETCERTIVPCSKNNLETIPERVVKKPSIITGKHLIKTLIKY